MITKLYKITATGAVQEWEVTKHGNRLRIQYGQKDGAKQEQWEVVETNQSGRSLDEQMELRAESRISRQLDKGYRYSIEEARNNVGMNAMDLLKPMLAQQFDKVKNIDYGNCFYQKKYNGHRCLITNTGDELIAYSRNGKVIETVNHILKGINIPEGVTLDGELYIHDTPLQDLGSMIRRKQANNVLLQYVVYDTIMQGSYARRIDELYSMSLGEGISIAPTETWHSKLSLKDELNSAIADGYEGLMLRHGDKSYEPGKRSSSLVKVKKCMDAEFLVIDVIPSKDGWGILVCKVGAETFRVPAPGTIENKTEILNNKHKYINRYITVEFFEWTNNGIPFHPRAMNWREDV